MAEIPHITTAAPFIPGGTGEHRHILSTDELSTDFMLAKIKRAEELRTTEGKELRESQQLLKSRKVGGLAVYIAMFEASTRTADKHALAAFWLDMHVLPKNIEASSLTKDESKRDMVMNIAAQGFDVLVIRDRAINTPTMAASLDVTAVINAGNGWKDHPTQAEADIYTAYREVGTTEGMTAVIAGDNYHGRVNRADIKMFSKFGNKLVLASLPGLEIQDDIRQQLQEQETEYYEVNSLLEAMEYKPDLALLSRYQKERYVGENPRTGEPWDTEKIERDYHTHMALTPQVMSAAKNTKILHPLPRGPELPDDDDPRIVIWPQVKNAVWMTVTDYEYIFGVGPFEDGQAT